MKIMKKGFVTTFEECPGHLGLLQGKETVPVDEIRAGSRRVVVLEATVREVGGGRARSELENSLHCRGQIVEIRELLANRNSYVADTRS